MDAIELIIYFLWSLQAVFQFLLWLYWIQVKEYRADRFKSFITSVEGRRKLKLILVMSKLVLLVVMSIRPDFRFVLFFIFISINAYYLILLSKRILRKPIFTERILKVIYVGALVPIIVLISSLATDFALSLLIGELSLLIAPLLGVVITKPLVSKIEQEEFEEASTILSQISPIVIGITGSYGKTTTKEFLTTILKSSYKVEKSKKNENTLFGIARKIINDLPKDTEVFVAEMGAYKMGEIRRLCEMARPKIGMITGIEPQHLDLFGSIENIKKAKFELIESLPKGGQGVFNISNEDTRQLYRKAADTLEDIQVYGYVMHNSIGKHYGDIVPDLESKVIESNVDGVKFEVYEDSIKHELFAPVTGIHFVENITGAILVARLLDIDWKMIKDSVSKLELPDRTMQCSALDYGSILIDDSYNSTPRGFLSALNFLSHFKNKNRVVITPGIIELGERSKGIHKKLGNALSNKSDYVIVTNSEPAKFLKEGFGEDDVRLDVVENDQKLLDAVDQLIENGSVILIEGRISAKVYQYIMNRIK